MSNAIAIALAIVIAALLIADHVWLHLGLPVLAGKALDGAVDYLSFWD